MHRHDNNSGTSERLFRLLPGVNELLEGESFATLLATSSREQLTQAVREALSQLRQQIHAGLLDEAGLESRIATLSSTVTLELHRRSRPRLRRVLNATGVILQTNLGRAPLSEEAMARISEVAGGYCNLEFDLEAGHRSRREVHAEDLLIDLSLIRTSLPPSSKDHLNRSAAVVNNCAAATFLALNTLAEGGEVIVSRGELVEIGGGFRIPEILAKSGAVLREVGTTNKTRASDYAAAIRPETKLILKVHRSNFRIEGFTEQPSLEELVALGKRTSVPVFEDQGTGCVLDLANVGLAGESSWLRSISSGAELVAASGDKLLGGPQCGLLLGDRVLVERLRSNPLYRALRVDKLTYAALEATLVAYLTGAQDAIPVVRMLHTPPEQIQARCQRLALALPSEAWQAEVIPAHSVVGGGTTPGASLQSFALALRHRERSEASLAAALRAMQTPVVGRVSDGRVVLDLRTIAPAEDDLLLAMLCGLQDTPHRTVRA